MDNKLYYEDIDEVIKNAKEQGVSKFLIPGASFDDLPQAIKLSEKYNEVYFAVGIHPYDIEQYDEKVLEKYISHPKCIAVGECGLDYFRLPEDEEDKKKNIKKQKEVFISQIIFAKKVKKPLIIHIREASQDAKKILEDYDAKEVGGVLHCYNADENLLCLSKHNFYFGIGGVITFKNAKKLLLVLDKIPRDRLLIETDAPYLTPHPFRGKRNEPLYTKYIVEKISKILNLSSNEIEDITNKNAYKLFKQFSTKN